MKTVDLSFPLRSIEQHIAEQRTIRKYLMREQTKLFLSDLASWSDHIWVSEFGSIWLTLRDQPGFTIEVNPKLFSILESISAYTESFKHVELRSVDSPDDFQRQYIFSFYWRAVNFRIAVDCYLTKDNPTCKRVQVGTKIERQSRFVEQEIEIPVYKFIC